MTASILMCIIFAYLFIYGVMCSHNRLVKTNMALFCALTVFLVLFAIDEGTSTHIITSFLSSIHNRSHGALYNRIVLTLGCLKAYFYFLAMFVSYGLTRFITHFIWVGSNPAVRTKRKSAVYVMNLLSFIVLSFVFTSIITAYSIDLFSFTKHGFLKEYIDVIYGWIV